MTTSGWVLLCVLGLVVGFIAGWTRRRRAQLPAAVAPPNPASRLVDDDAATSSHRAARDPDGDDEPDIARDPGGDGAPETGDPGLDDEPDAGHDPDVDGAPEAGDPGLDDEPDAAPDPDVDDHSSETAVVDLRVVPAPGPEAPAPVPTVDRQASAPTGPVRRLSLAPTAGVAVIDRIDRREADVSDTDQRERDAVNRPADEPAVDRAEPAEAPDADVIDLAAGRSAVALHNLQFVAGIGPRLDKRLRANGIVTVEDLAATGSKVLRRLIADHLPESEARRLRDDARARMDDAQRGRIAQPDPGHELRRVQGIGTTMMRWLETQGITSLDQLAALSRRDIDRLETELSDYPGRIRAEKWRGQARRLIAEPAP